MKHFSNPTEVNMEKIKEQIESLKSENKTMVLATKTSNNQAEASYVPYVYLNNTYYILLSQIASHYDNISEMKEFQGMILESEQSAMNTFFRRRAIFNFMYEKINNADEIVEHFVSQHGELVKKLLTMDFNIFELKLINGRAVLGAGQAFRLDENENIIEQITSK